MRSSLAALLFVVPMIALAACAPKTETPVAGAADPVPPPVDAGAQQKRFPLPDCTTVQAVDAGAAGWEHPDCRIQSADTKGLAFEARYTKPVEGQQMTVTVQVVAPGDATVQAITEKMDGTFSAPSLQDIDGDGRDELLVPLMTGNVNTNWAVWRSKGDSDQYVRVEELSGVDIGRTVDGFITVSARSSAASWNVEYWKFDGDDLEHIATAAVTAEGDGQGNVTKSTCTVEDKGGLADEGLTPASAQSKFCSEPAAADIFK
jgi:hypothetical protein